MKHNMHIDMVRDVAEFLQKFDLMYAGPPRRLQPDMREFRITAALEEVKEYAVANTMAGELDALVDSVYFTLGTALLHGFDFRCAWERVHAKNMEKVRVKSAEESKRDSEYDVVKPPGWTPPDLHDLTEGWTEFQAHMEEAVSQLTSDSEVALAGYQSSVLDESFKQLTTEIMTRGAKNGDE